MHLSDKPMKKILLVFCCLASAAFVSAKEPSTATSAIPPKIPVRDFFKNPESRGYLLSPDGKTLSYLAPWESRMNIWVRPTAGGEAKRITSEKDRDIRDYFWKGNQFVIYAQDNKGDENFHLFRVDLKSGDIKDLTPFPKVRSELIDDLEDISETDILDHAEQAKSGIVRRDARQCGDRRDESGRGKSRVTSIIG